MRDVQYGVIESTTVLDNNGSTVTSEESVVKGSSTGLIRRKYRIKFRVHNQTEEYDQYMKFSNDLSQDKTMLDPYFEISHTKSGDEHGYYYVVRCYTVLEY